MLMSKKSKQIRGKYIIFGKKKTRLRDMIPLTRSICGAQSRDMTSSALVVYESSFKNETNFERVPCWGDHF